MRELEREIGAICRKVARQVAEGRASRKVTISAARARELLGSAASSARRAGAPSEPGVATGLAWTPAGGDVLFVEATAMPGSGKLTITGQLGDVMKESAQAALSYVRSHRRDGIADDWFARHDIHIHVPAGAIPKDGPSAGVTMATALCSLLSGRPVRSDVAMTGEITLPGQVLPIGGLKEKVLAAQRSGIRHVIAPARNAQDVDEIPAHLRRDLELHFVSRIDEVLEIALSAARATRTSRPVSLREQPAVANQTPSHSGCQSSILGDGRRPLRSRRQGRSGDERRSAGRIGQDLATLNAGKRAPDVLDLAAAWPHRD